MSGARLEQYRHLLAQNAANNDPLVLIKTDDLRELLDVFEWFAANPKRVKAASRSLVEA